MGKQIGEMFGWARQRKVIEAVWSLEKQASVSDLMRMLTADSVAAPTK